jgi:hypothetical protein
MTLFSSPDFGIVGVIDLFDVEVVFVVVVVVELLNKLFLGPGVGLRIPILDGVADDLPPLFKGELGRCRDSLLVGMWLAR